MTKENPVTTTAWFTTTPEAILRAESMLAAFDEGRFVDLGEIFAVDNPVLVLVALIGMCDRFVDYIATTSRPTTPTHRAIRREAARVVATALYTITKTEE